jgi:hypothetical protein
MIAVGAAEGGAAVGVGVGIGVDVGLGLCRRRRLLSVGHIGSKELNPPVTSAALLPAVVRKNSRRVTSLSSGTEGCVIRRVPGLLLGGRQQRPAFYPRPSLPREPCKYLSLPGLVNTIISDNRGL